ncbi:MAG TPA: cobalamin-dependent protein [Micromonospora sp.]|nr:cobalamin-dependent protein [Micromonospora sp.]
MALDIVVTSTSSDSHTWNLVFLQLLLEESGHRVISLGACVPDAVLLQTTQQRRPDLIVISSVNGHGRQDGLRVIRALRACPQLAATPVVIGGKLDTIGSEGDSADVDLIAAGFNGVFTDDVAAFRQYVELLARAGRDGRVGVG